MKKTILQASYMKNFQCLGSTCEDTCCSGWSVDIDKATFTKYKKIPDKKVKGELAKHVKRNKYETTFSDYATIRFGADGFCPFLNQDKLCSIQLKMGEKYLSRTCASYPRLQNQLYDDFELAGAVSCPEIARLALLNPDGITLEESENDWKDPVFDKLFEDGSLQPYFESLRTFIISLLQNRSINLEERLLILGFFLQELSELVDEEAFLRIPELLKSYADVAGAQKTLDSMGQIEVRHDLQLTLLHTLIEGYVKKNAPNKRYMQCYEEFSSAIGHSAQRYEEACQTYYQPFMNEHGYILENYLVNYVFSKLFPFVSNRSIFDDYIVMILHYSLIKMHLIGLAGHHQGLTTEIVIALIYSFARTYEHDVSFFSEALDYLAAEKRATMQTMAVLIKN